MNDPLLKQFGWLTPVIQHDSSDYFSPGSLEKEVLDELKEGWGKSDTSILLRKLSENYGPEAGTTVEKYLGIHIGRSWAKVGSREAHPGTEIDDFIRILWGPLPSEGFLFTQKKVDGKVEFCVTKCPIFELAKMTDMHKWLYHFACSTDFISACAFSSRIEFCRTKTLMEGHECCNHTYSYKDE
jgi:predicted ArsR family transcriptional regulator